MHPDTSSYYFILQGLMLRKDLRLQQDSEDAKNEVAMAEMQFEAERL